MRTIEKKILPGYFREVIGGTKTFEIRKDEDAIAAGDHIDLREWDPENGGYTGQHVEKEVTYVLRDAEEYGLMPGHCVIGLGKPITKPNIKYLIVGRAGVGKDTLAKALGERGMKQVRSFTTRPKRTDDEDTHIFVSPETAGGIGNRIAETTVNGYEYFATKEQIDSANLYIVDPKGFTDITSRMPDTAFIVLHVTANKDEAKAAAVERAEDPGKELEIIERRMIDEDDMFSDFEAIEEYPDNCAIIEIDNPMVEKEAWAKEWADAILREQVYFNNLLTVVRTIKAQDKVEVTGTKIRVYRRDLEPTDVSDEVFTAMVIKDREGLTHVMEAYLHSNL